jgi:DNA-binding transcriptional ArsR family regulator
VRNLFARQRFIAPQAALFLGAMALDIFPYWHVMFSDMARAATTSDVFNAVAEPRRREILTLLVVKELPVGDIVTALRVDQPSVSKHLRVLRDVGLVHVRRSGRHKLYRTNAHALQPLHEWTAMFEQYWSHQLSRVKERAEAKISHIPATNSTSFKEKKEK